MPVESQEKLKPLIEDLPIGSFDKRYFDHVDDRLHYVGSIKRYPRFKSAFRYSSHYRNYVEVRGREKFRNTTYAPAGINPNAMYKATGKSCKLDKFVPQETQDILLDWLVKHFHLYVSGSRIITVQEAFEKLSKGSDGFPLAEFWANHAEFMEDWFFPYVEKRLDEFHHADFDGDEFVQEMFTEGTKTERLPLVKVLADKIRVFCGANVFFKLIAATCCHDFNEKLCSAAGRTWSFCGGQHFYGGWNALARKLLAHPNLLESDGVQWDSTLVTVIFMIIARFRFMMLRPCDQTARNWNLLRNVYRNIMFTPFINIFGEILLKCMGNPSGQNSTIADNTLALFIVLAFCWLKLAPKPTYQAFMSLVEAALCGDDNLLGVHDDAISYFNPDTIEREAGKFGPEFEFANPRISRADKHNNYHGLLARTFLSKNFGRDTNGFWLPVPTRERMVATMAIVKRDTLPFLLEMVSAALLNGWALKEVRNFCRQFALDLIHDNHSFFYKDPEWIASLTMLLPDIDYGFLYYGYQHVTEGVCSEDLQVINHYNLLRSN